MDRTTKQVIIRFFKGDKSLPANIWGADQNGKAHIISIIGKDLVVDEEAVIVRRTKDNNFILYRDWRSYRHGIHEEIVNYINANFSRRVGAGKMTTKGLYYGGDHEEEL